MSVRNLVGRMIPGDLKYYMYSLNYYWEDIRRYKKYSNGYLSPNKEKILQGKIIVTYHIIEKGLTMPDMRAGFGKDALNTLIGLCNTYIDKQCNQQDDHFMHAVKLLNEYVRVHREMAFALDPALVEKIRALSERTKVMDTCSQLGSDNDEYFRHADSPFRDFAFSRHSIRNFIDKPVDRDLIMKAVEIAQKSPSSCNRQPNRVYILENKDNIQWLLESQKGNRGFGQLIDKVIILTAEVGVFNGFTERNEAFLNSGMYAMSLLYGLHYYRIGAVSLAYVRVSKEDDKKLRALCGIPDSEVVSMLIGCGHVPGKLSIASSPRYKVDKIVKVVS